ncbi:hypothetical protein BSKO_11471 [Bryopsis sp. KO-2023]|nr:hypothetical protein BSKO_11471 [Bryopsis sp. KO-2023]
MWKVAAAMVLLCALLLQGAAARDLKAFNFLTTRGWSIEKGLGLGFTYEDYGGNVDFGPFTFTKDPPSDPDPPPPLIQARSRI